MTNRPKPLDYSKAIQVAEHVWWVGYYDPKDSFQCNPYLIIEKDAGVLIDPGSVLSYDILIEKIEQVFSVKQISHIVIQHQDPDVCGNIALLIERLHKEGNKTVQVYCHWRTAVLIRHYGAKCSFIYTDRLPKGKIALNNRTSLKCIHTPYLHAPGAIVTYYKKDRVLFSSDIFGGVTPNWQLYADEEYFESITSFHKDYMPSKEILLYSMLKIEDLNLNLIAPQHGSIIYQPLIPKIIHEFKNFDCGLYIDQSFKDELEKAQKQIEEQNRIMNEEMTMAGHFQRTLLPASDITSCDSRIDIAYHFQPSSKVSGDFIIIEKLDTNHLGMMVCDVMGHGVMAGLTTIEIRTLFQQYRHLYKNPEALLRKINEMALSSVANNVFFTAIYAVFNFETSEMKIASAGGLPSLFRSAKTKEVEVISIAGNPIGLFSGDDFLLTEHSMQFNEGDTILFQTDGYLEAESEAGEMFDSPSNPQKIIDELCIDCTSQEIINRIHEKVTLHRGKEKAFDDDTTVIVFKRRFKDASLPTHCHLPH